MAKIPSEVQESLDTITRRVERLRSKHVRDLPLSEIDLIDNVQNIDVIRNTAYSTGNEQIRCVEYSGTVDGFSIRGYIQIKRKGR